MKTGKIEEIRIEEIEEMETDTMSKLEKVFDTPNKKAFIGFLTAGDPDADSTVQFILEMEKAGADLIEIGIPFSDPTAEGVVIQEANIRSLGNGMTTDGVFEIVKRVREQSQIPLAFMTYVNPVFHYGYEKFFTKCEELGISAIIIPDVPYEEKAEVEAPAKAHGVKVISMVAPTSESRIRQIASEAEGFIYVVSSMGVTGVRSEIKTDLPGHRGKYPCRNRCSLCHRLRYQHTRTGKGYGSYLRRSHRRKRHREDHCKVWQRCSSLYRRICEEHERGCSRVDNDREV